MKPTFEITKVEVLKISGNVDEIFVYTSLPTPFPLGIASDVVTMKFTAPMGTGGDYVRYHLGIEPHVVEVNLKRG